jgi:RNA polymerase sigma factor (TIGR02999 family)
LHFAPSRLDWTVMDDLTQILNGLERGDPRAARDLLPLVYDELRRLAAQRLAQEQPGQTLQATALVHEAYLRLVGRDKEAAWNGRGHFFAAAAEAMRRILVENARRKRTLKQGGNRVRQEFDEALLAAPETHEDLEALDEALQLLAVADPVKARLVELRYFAGLTNEEAAATLGISTATAERYWAYARAWLRRRISMP